MRTGSWTRSELRLCQFIYDIEVLGTKFNVIADEATGAFSAALVRGKIKILDHNASEQIIMVLTDVVILVNGHLQYSKIEDDDAYIWAEGYINLKEHSFAEPLTELEKVFDTHITIEGSIEGADCKYQWGKIRIADGIDDALRVLRASYQFTYQRNTDKNKVIITGQQHLFEYELLTNPKWKSLWEKSDQFEYIEIWHNKIRRHSALKNMSIDEFWKLNK